jgi:hypothetical protein
MACTLALTGSLARMYCPVDLPGRLARQKYYEFNNPQNAFLRPSRRPASSIAYFPAEGRQFSSSFSRN